MDRYYGFLCLQSYIPIDYFGGQCQQSRFCTSQMRTGLQTVCSLDEIAPLATTTRSMPSSLDVCIEYGFMTLIGRNPCVVFFFLFPILNCYRNHQRCNRAFAAVTVDSS
ncbi:hypothetical protein P171DRAFT_43071 [Karstenula rhodostoma CBS 690.94]|uniref:Uncharacterized protein n=1 Tax=Karstenula rhodostoma CBS 690.94 TaxID=1392251 RepID=A0A9P4PIU5_9PLEO|nr:hypothetical protein P171DRAFT_43071 [Karstenula rhodostoma CBS 690.94]